MIGCQQAEAARLELAGGELPGDQAVALEEHLASCATCSAFVLELDGLEAGLTQITHADADLAHGGHAARFLETLRQQPELGQPLVQAGPATEDRPRPVRGRRFPFRALGVLAAAAAVTAAVGLGLFGSPQDAAGPLRLVRGLDERDYRPGESLRPGDRIQATRAQPMSLPGAVLTPAEGSVVRVDRLLPRTVTLERGAVACAVVPGSGQFLVRAKLGVVSVVGTRFVVVQLPTELRVEVSEGVVEVAAAQGIERVSVQAGQVARVSQAGQIAVTGEAPAETPVVSPTPGNTPGPVATPMPGVDGPDRVVPQLLNRGQGALFGVTGQVPWLPDGTSLHVSLNTPGSGPQELRVAFFKVIMASGRFEGSFQWPGKRFAPLTYTTSVSLYMGGQPAHVKAQLAREFGFTGELSQLIAAAEVSLGTPTERETHERESLNAVQGFLEGVRELRNKALEAIRFDPTDSRWPRAHANFESLASLEQEALRDFEGGFVALREGDLLHEVRNAISDEILALERHEQEPGFDAAVQLAGVGVRLDAVEGEIQTRRPIDLRVPDDQ